MSHARVATTLLLAALAAEPLGAHAALLPTLVKNIGPLTSPSTPKYFTDVDGTAFFSAFTYGVGAELWKTDGTEHGTVMVKDVNPGVISAGHDIPFGYNSYPHDLTNVDGTLFFTAYHEDTGREVWKSDGTEAGTVLVKDIIPGDAFGDPFNLVAANGLLFFTTGENNHRLWVSDGTEAGTQALPHPGIFTPGNGIVTIGTRVFFTPGEDYFGGYLGNRELWTSDGTPGGTAAVGTFSGGVYIQRIGGHQTADELGGALIFRGCNPDCQIWRSDGTIGGTLPLTSLAGGVVTAAGEIRSAGTKAFFFNYQPATGYELWVTDGTGPGTGLAAELVPGPDDAAIVLPSFTGHAGIIYFLVFEEPAPGLGGLWRSDGTQAGTYRLASFLVDVPSDDYMVNADGILLFRRRIGSDDHELWRSDGTMAGTYAVSALGGDYPGFEFAAVGGSLVFMHFAGDLIGQEPFIYLANCGDGGLDTGEQCDHGAANGTDGICSTECRLEQDLDADGEPNATDNCPSIWNDSQADADGDGEGDACEACMGGASVTKAQLKVQKLEPPAGDDKLLFKGFAIVPTAPFIAPDVTGARILVEDAAGADVVNVSLPDFGYDSVEKNGWKTSGNFLSFKYSDALGIQGVTKVAIKVSASTPGLVKFSVKGKFGSYASALPNLPLTATLSLAAEPVVGQCAVATFPNPPGTPASCVADAAGKKVTCK